LGRDWWGKGVNRESKALIAALAFRHCGIERLTAWARESGIEAEGDALLTDERVRSKMEEEALGGLEAFARFERPKKVDSSEKKLSLRQINARYPLQLKRKKSLSRPGRRRTRRRHGRKRVVGRVSTRDRGAVGRGVRSLTERAREGVPVPVVGQSPYQQAQLYHVLCSVQHSDRRECTW
jgi:hypothetical protein